MKKTALILSVVLSLAFEAILVARQQPAPGGGAHLGTWELVSMKYGDAKEFSDYPKDHRRLKMITATHFTWVDYDPKTGKVNSMAGGPYSLKAVSYTHLGLSPAGCSAGRSVPDRPWSGNARRASAWPQIYPGRCAA